MAQSTIFYENLPYKLSYELIGQDKEKSILILHGWGSNKELMIKAFKEPLKNFCQIYLDLPGFGKSSIEKILQSKDYALIVQKFLEQKGLKVNLFMGHSFGGKIATLLAHQNQAFLILLSSAGIVAPKSLKVRFKISLFKKLKALGLGHFYRFFASKDASNLSPLMYETFKNVVDEDFSEFFTHFKQRALIFWGEKDSATPLKSGEQISHLIQNSTFYPLSGDHFFFLNHAPIIAKTLEKEF